MARKVDSQDIHSFVEDQVNFSPHGLSYFSIIARNGLTSVESGGGNKRKWAVKAKKRRRRGCLLPGTLTLNC